MTRQTRRYVGWAFIWAITIIGSFAAFQKADQYFSNYLASFGNSQRQVSELIPANVSAFCYDPDFQSNWRKIRSSTLYTNLRNASFTHDLADRWDLNERELSSFETWVLEHWGPGASIAVSKQHDTVYLLSPVGNGEQSFEWLRKALASLKRQNVAPELHRIDNHWCIRSDSSPFWPRNLRVEFYPVQGMGVLAMGLADDPMSGIFDAEDEPQQSLFRNPDFPRFFEENFNRKTGEQGLNVFGFVRQAKESSSYDLGNTWTLLKNVSGSFDVEITIPDHSRSTEEPSSTLPVALTSQRAPEQFITITSSVGEIQSLLEEASPWIPVSLKETFSAVNLPTLLGSYYELWKPVIDKIGNDFFLAFGDADLLSEKFRVPFPRTTMVVPFEDKNLLISVLEQTVLKANEGLNSNLSVRKIVGNYGEYYEVKMSDSEWRNEHGLKTLPFFSLTDHYLIISTHQSSIEAILQILNGKKDEPSDAIDKAEEQKPVTNGSSLSLRVDMQNAPNIIRVLFGTVGLVNPNGDNIFLSPHAMSLFSETFSLMQQFKEASVDLSYLPKKRLIKIHLAPMPPTEPRPKA